MKHAGTSRIFNLRPVKFDKNAQGTLQDIEKFKLCQNEYFLRPTKYDEFGFLYYPCLSNL
jgi:hypothetical protein